MQDINDIAAFNEERRNSILKGFTNADDLLEKGGEGTKGGKIIGHTKSGKAIYDSKHTSYAKADYTESDHKEIAKFHKQAIGKVYDNAADSPIDAHKRLAAEQLHSNLQAYHVQLANSKRFERQTTEHRMKQ